MKRVIFCIDLDGTLGHAQSTAFMTPSLREMGGVTMHGGEYLFWPRPGAVEGLELLRQQGEVWAVTAGKRRHAGEFQRLLDFRFDRILGREDEKWAVGEIPTGVLWVLVDDAPSGSFSYSAKMIMLAGSKVVDPKHYLCCHSFYPGSPGGDSFLAIAEAAIQRVMEPGQ